RLAPLARGRVRPRRSVLVVLLRGRRPRTIALPPRRRLHLGDGLRVRLDEPRDRARHPARRPDRLAVHRGRVPWGDPPGRDPRLAVPARALTEPRRRGTHECGSWARRAYGGPRGHGHEHLRGITRLEAVLRSRLHGDEPFVRHGLGLDLDG